MSLWIPRSDVAMVGGWEPQGVLALRCFGGIVVPHGDAVLVKLQGHVLNSRPSPLSARLLSIGSCVVVAKASVAVPLQLQTISFGLYCLSAVCCRLVVVRLGITWFLPNQVIALVVQLWNSASEFGSGSGMVSCGYRG